MRKIGYLRAAMLVGLINKINIYSDRIEKANKICVSIINTALSFSSYQNSWH